MDMRKERHTTTAFKCHSPINVECVQKNTSNHVLQRLTLSFRVYEGEEVAKNSG